MGDVLGAVARDVEGGVAGAMFGELMAPEVAVGTALGDPESAAAVSYWTNFVAGGEGKKAWKKIGDGALLVHVC